MMYHINPTRGMSNLRSVISMYLLTLVENFSHILFIHQVLEWSLYLTLALEQQFVSVRSYTLMQTTVRNSRVRNWNWWAGRVFLMVGSGGFVWAFAKMQSLQQSVIDRNATSAVPTAKVQSLSPSGAAGFAVKAIYDYTAADKDEVSVLIGEELEEWKGQSLRIFLCTGRGFVTP